MRRFGTAPYLRISDKNHTHLLQHGWADIALPTIRHCRRLGAILLTSLISIHLVQRRNPVLQVLVLIATIGLLLIIRKRSYLLVWYHIEAKRCCIQSMNFVRSTYVPGLPES